MGKVYAKTYPKTYPKVYGKTNPPASLQDVLALSPAAMYDVSVLSSLYQDSLKTTPVTASSDPVGAVEDLTGNLPDFLQIIASSRGLYTVSGTSRYITLDGIDDRYLCSTKSGFNSMHDGTGGERISLFQFGTSANPNDRYCMMATAQISTTEYGFADFYDDRSASGRSDAYSGYSSNAATTVYNLTDDDVLTPNSPVVIGASYSSSDSPEFRLYEDGLQVSSATETATPSTNDATNNLVLGRDHNGNWPILGRWYMSVFFDRILTPAERSIVVTYAKSLRG